MTEALEQAIKNSVLWAAYGDALGFISELADEAGRKKRAKTSRLVTTIPWTRQIGGRFGANVEMPAGCYSDDTELRFATSRAIRGDGRFDVEAFAKIELPVWRGYALGAGRGTKAAAARLIQPDVNWFSNFFSEPIKYLDSGGNGAAMRIQPHVWAAKTRRDSSFLKDVIRNAICTHGHPRGILGAIFHSQCLRSALDESRIPDPEGWMRLVESCEIALDVFRHDGDLSAFWLPAWESKTDASFADAFSTGLQECKRDLALARQLLQLESKEHRPLELTYERIVKELGGLSEQNRGTGTTTAIIAVVLAWIYQGDPSRGMEVAANLLYSDTDTIATMSGALLGAVTREAPPGPLQDTKYLESEAARLSAISHGQKTGSFAYPDLMTWRPPRTQVEIVSEDQRGFEVVSLGHADAVGREYGLRGNAEYIFQWMRLQFGQTILTKRRAGNKLAKKPAESFVSSQKYTEPLHSTQKALFAPAEAPNGTSLDSRKPAALLDQKTAEAIRSGFSVAVLGQHLLELAALPDGIELAIGYAAIIAKARKSRDVNTRKSG